jgi:hypothetical protein
MMRLLLIAMALAGGGCATFDEDLQSASPQVRECAEWYAALDAAVGEAGVRDAQYTRVSRFPYLRIDRLHAALAERAAASEAALHAWVERLVELDMDARRHEIENLPRSSVDALPGLGLDYSRGFALKRTRDCARLLREIDLAKPQARAALLERAHVPDDYSSASRLIGLYALTRVAFADGIKRWQEETFAMFAGDVAAAPGASVVRYAPPANAALPRGAVAGLLGRAQFDALGFPSLSEREFERLVTAYAPSFEVVIAGDSDRFGLVRWRRGAEVPEVDASDPAVYVHHAYTRYSGRILLQLVYTIWFPERAPATPNDILAGRLDGLVWRVTLAPDGEPLVYDAIHPCGCYHEFFPTPRARARPAPDRLEEWVFVPQRLPVIGEYERPVVRIASGTHYIERVGVVRGADSLVRYAFYPYDALRSMPDLQGGKRSIFRPDGIVAGTERAERFLFWPMGIASAGAMRQWGRHATAFVGRRHFDDADLLERRFELDFGEHD